MNRIWNADNFNEWKWLKRMNNEKKIESTINNMDICCNILILPSVCWYGVDDKHLLRCFVEQIDNQLTVRYNTKQF